MGHTGAVRIALVHYTYLPTIAGVEWVMAAHARLFVQAGRTVTIVADRAAVAEPAGTQLAGTDLGVRSARALRVQGELAGGGPGPIFAQAVEEWVAELRPILAAHDVVMLHNVATMHFHPALTAALWRLAEELPKVRFICWVHDLAARNPDYAAVPFARAPWSLLTRGHPRFEYVAVSALRQRQFTELTGQPPDRCRTIPNGMNPATLLDLSPRLSELADRHGLFERDLVLLQPARLLRRKNVELTLRVIAALREAGHSCAALITAPPEVQSSTASEYEREVRALHAGLGLADEVFFLSDHGPLDAREMRALFQIADALFFPSRQEGFGIPLLEAALHRLPVFCSEIEPLTRLLPGGVSAFALDATPEMVAKLIRCTLAADPAYIARRTTVKNFSWTAIYRNFLSPLLTETEPNTRHEYLRARSHP